MLSADGTALATARFLYEGYFEFHLQAKIFIDTNHLPNVTDRTLFESGRLKIIPFTRHFEDHEQDKTLKTTLMQPENLSGILNWCIEGYKLYKAEGLDEPNEVKTATEEYRVDSDRIAQFMAQCLKKEKGSEIKAANVYNRYKDWCSENGYKYEGSVHFYKRLSMEYIILKRRPWKAETTGNSNPTNLVNDIAWVTGEEPDIDLVPVEGS
jgi:putative DNA primase/helicase